MKDHSPADPTLEGALAEVLVARDGWAFGECGCCRPSGIRESVWVDAFSD